jgi:hypothetical protein
VIGDLVALARDGRASLDQIAGEHNHCLAGCLSESDFGFKMSTRTFQQNLARSRLSGFRVPKSYFRPSTEINVCFSGSRISFYFRSKCTRGIRDLQFTDLSHFKSKAVSNSLL